jgi:hypothetical protein
MSRRHQLSMESYDQFSPNQDTTPKGGFGNLITLPPQRKARDARNSVFVGYSFKSWANQWEFLASVKRSASTLAYALADDASRRVQVIGVCMSDVGNEDDRTPWKRPPSDRARKAVFRSRCRSRGDRGAARPRHRRLVAPPRIGKTVVGIYDYVDQSVPILMKNESFMVDSKNYMEQSTGTTAWIAEYRRLLDRCVAEEKRGSLDDIQQAFDTLFGLLDYIDECNDDVIFFADEGGSWQVGVDWDRVLPPWFRVLSTTATPKEYAERIDSLLVHHYNYGRDKMLAVDRKAATPEQRKALIEAADRQPRQRRERTRP